MASLLVVRINQNGLVKVFDVLQVVRIVLFQHQLFLFRIVVQSTLLGLSIVVLTDRTYLVGVDFLAGVAHSHHIGAIRLLGLRHLQVLLLILFVLLQ